MEGGLFDSYLLEAIGGKLGSWDDLGLQLAWEYVDFDIALTYISLVIVAV